MSFLHFDTSDIAKKLKEIGELDKKAAKATVSALNRSGTEARTAAARKLKEIYFVKYGEVLRKIEVIKANRNRLSVLLTARDRAIRLINFSVNPKNKPSKRPKVIRAAVKKGEGKKKIQGAFIAEVRGNHIGVFKRTPYAKHRKTAAGHWSQGPIDQLRGPAIPVMLSQPGVVSHIQEVAASSITKRLDHELKRQKVIK